MLVQGFLKVMSLLQNEGDGEELAISLLECLVNFSEADAGYIVMQENGSFEMKHRVNFSGSHDPRYRFSRSLVRTAIAEGRITFSENLKEDARFRDKESVALLANQAVIAVPLCSDDMVRAVVYLERQQHSFSSQTLEQVHAFMAVAGQMISRSLRLAELERFRKERLSDLKDRYDFNELVGHSPALTGLMQTIAQVAETEATVLIHGETGSGKELVARALYANSPRAHKPFVTLHCGALPETLFESELFGHKRGSFSGAHNDRAGRVALAHGGTLFIDEVGEIPLAAQAKLLRFFQFGEFQRVGSDRTEKVDVRIVAATHRDLREMVAQGKFREDLYYRLNVIELSVPPLRERREDILPLVQHFLKRHFKGNTPPRIGQRLMHILETYPFPGNVRELAHAMERLCILSDDGELHEAHLPDQIQGRQVERLGDCIAFKAYSNDELKAVRKQAGDEAVNLVEKRFLEGLMRISANNVNQAADHAGFNRTYLYRLLAKHNIT